MTLEQEQKLLLSIVETWRLSEIPEYRGFRCANCQKYKNKAWYHWVDTGGYKFPIHMCDDECEPAFQTNTIEIDQNKRKEVDRQEFGKSYLYSPQAIKRFQEIVDSWPLKNEAGLKEFTCDHCEKVLLIDDSDQVRKGYHVWWKMSDGITLVELHFHKHCGSELGIKE